MYFSNRALQFIFWCYNVTCSALLQGFYLKVVSCNPMVTFSLLCSLVASPNRSLFYHQCRCVFFLERRGLEICRDGLWKLPGKMCNLSTVFLEALQNIFCVCQADFQLLQIQKNTGIGQGLKCYLPSITLIKPLSYQTAL